MNLHLLLPHVATNHRVVTTLVDNTATIRWVSNMFATVKDLAEAEPAHNRPNITRQPSPLNVTKHNRPNITRQPSPLNVTQHNRPNITRQPSPLNVTNFTNVPARNRLHITRQLSNFKAAYIQRQNWLLTLAHFTEQNGLCLHLNYIKSEHNVMPDAFSRANEPTNSDLSTTFYRPT